MAASKLGKNFWLAVFSLVGTTVGAGIFSLPYVFSKSGFIIGTAEFFALVGAILLVQLIVGEIALRTEEKKRVIGYADRYLSSQWKFFASVSVIFGSVGALLVYLILGGRFLSFIVGKDVFASSLVFFVFWFALILVRPRNFGRAELISGFSIILIILSIFSLNAGRVDLNNFKGFDLSNLFLPYGVILFAVSGFYVIPEMEDILGGEKRKLKKAIIFGTLIPAVIYLFFVYIVLGVSGSLTSEDAVSGLAAALNSQFIILLGSLLGLLAVFEASLSSGVYLRETLWYDLKLNKWLAWFITGLLPLALFVFGVRNLITVISVVGALFFAFEAIIVLLIHRQSKLSELRPDYEIKLPNFGYYFIGSLAVFGAALEVWRNFFM